VGTISPAGGIKGEEFIIAGLRVRVFLIIIQTKKNADLSQHLDYVCVVD
jgi:hypothetical protein